MKEDREAYRAMWHVPYLLLRAGDKEKRLNAMKDEWGENDELIQKKGMDLFKKLRPVPCHAEGEWEPQSLHGHVTGLSHAPRALTVKTGRLSNKGKMCQRSAHLRSWIKHSENMWSTVSGNPHAAHSGEPDFWTVLWKQSRRMRNVISETSKNGNER